MNPVIIDSEEIEKFLFANLLKRGYAPSVKEIEDIADIVFDYLVLKKIIEEDEE